MKILVCSDIHGEHEKLTNFFDKFLSENYDKAVLLGDLADSYTRTNEDILRCFKIALEMKDLLKDRMIWLWSNHDWQYYYGRQMCSGFRGDLCISLNPLLNEIHSYLQMAYEYDNYLFTHAGVQKKWYNKYKHLIEPIEADRSEEHTSELQSH